MLSRLEGHNALRSERGLRNAGSELLEDLCRFSNPVGTQCWAQLLGGDWPRRSWEVLQSFPGKVQQRKTHLCLTTWAIPSLCSCWSENLINQKLIRFCFLVECYASQTTLISHVLLWFSLLFPKHFLLLGKSGSYFFPNLQLLKHL